jgi:hypothetical protein
VDPRSDGPARENPKSATFARFDSVSKMLEDFTSRWIIGLSAQNTLPQMSSPLSLLEFFLLLYIHGCSNSILVSGSIGRKVVIKDSCSN